MKTFKYIIPLLFLALSCTKEPVAPPTPAYDNTTLHYLVTATSGNGTKATLNEDTQSINAGTHYVFEEGDRLFVSHVKDHEDVLFGVLTLISGAGDTSAQFEGDLVCAEDFEPTSSTPITVTLVGASGTDRIHTVANGKITATTYPNDETAFATSFQDAVRKYGNFTCNGTLGETRFTLDQKTSFVQFCLTYESDRSESAPAIVKFRQGGTELRSVTIDSPAQLSENAKQVRFVLPFEGGADLFSAATELTVQNGREGTPVSFDKTMEVASLAANNYYTVRRTSFNWDGFAIKATQDGTTVKVNYYSGITGDRSVTTMQYSLDEGASWTEYTAVEAISLNAGDRLCLRGVATKYNGYNAPNQLFHADKLCQISGDMMSLMCNSNWERATSVGVDAFNSLFKNATWIDIDRDAPMTLSATTLGNKCYKNMFNGCTQLTTAPVLPAATLVGNGNDGCYNQMFSGCKKLTYVKCLATSNMGDKKSTVNWMQNVPTGSAGTFVKDSGTTWPEGVHGIPSGWTVQDAS